MKMTFNIFNELSLFGSIKYNQLLMGVLLQLSSWQAGAIRFVGFGGAISCQNVEGLYLDND